jgi:hypothetical protein
LGWSYPYPCSLIHDKLIKYACSWSQHGHTSDNIDQSRLIIDCEVLSTFCLFRSDVPRTDAITGHCLIVTTILCSVLTYLLSSTGFS